MKVLLVNGSPHPRGCTYTALSQVAETLNGQGIDTEIFHIGARPISGCIACGKCSETGRCIIDDKVNEFLALAESADGFVFGTPVYYASANGAMMSFLDRAFYSDVRGGKNRFYLKPGCAVISARRSGTTATFDIINKYFTISHMPIVSSQYWNMVHGNSPEEVLQDLEGLQIMRTLGRNMAWLLKSIEAGKKSGVALPEREKKISTNFIR